MTISFNPANITAAQYANGAQTALQLTTSDLGMLLVFREHADDWAAALSAITALSLTIAPFVLPDPKTMLLAYLASERYNAEIAGLTIPGVGTVATDRDSQSQITSAYAMAQSNLLTGGVQWKLGSGSFINLTQAQVITLGQAIAVFVQRCFSAESAVALQINSGAITTNTQVDAALTTALS